MTITAFGVAERLTRIRSQIDRACADAGRPSGGVQLVAVSKQQPSQLIREASLLGQLDFGESYAQEFAAKQVDLTELTTLSWHFIGHLQSNKAKFVVGRCKLIQSVDSGRIAGKIAGIAEKLGIRQDVLVEVNIGGEQAKTGVSSSEASSLCDKIIGNGSLRLLGLMGIAPASESAVGSGKSFAKLKTLFDQLPDDNRQILSMGMSTDFVLAIAEGSTMVRIGSAIFGSRTKL